MLNLILSLLPGVVIILFIYNKDRHSPEPKKMVAQAIFWGCLSTIPAVGMTLGSEWLLGVANDTSNTFYVAIDTFVCIGGSEELAKFFFLYFFFFRHDEFDEPLDGIVYAVCVSMGFAILENVLYVLGGGLNVAIMRMFTAVPAHAAFGVLMGYFVGLAKFANPNKKGILLLQGFLLAVLAHGAYDFFLFQKAIEALVLMAFVVLVISLFMSRRLIKKHQEDSKNRLEDREELV